MGKDKTCILFVISSGSLSASINLVNVCDKDLEYLYFLTDLRDAQCDGEPACFDTNGLNITWNFNTNSTNE